MSELGKCRHCGYEPLHKHAKFCRRCSARDPVYTPFPFKEAVYVALGIIAIVGFVWLTRTVTNGLEIVWNAIF